MKTFLYILLPFIFLTASCDSDDNDCQGIDCLPAATQTGAGTFGCLVNGEPFVDNSGSFNCFYQLVDGEYFFNISAEFNNQVPIAISLATNSLEINSSTSYQLLNRTEGNFFAEVTFDNNPPSFLNDNTTDNLNSGTININQLNFENNIVSGTFNFRITDTINNNTYNVTQGRFDSFFTQ